MSYRGNVKCPDAAKEVNKLSWRNSAGAMLSEMMEMAGYSTQSQSFHFDFFARNVAPALGSHPEVDRKPPLWPSFMTDDGSPMELSWSWFVKDPTPVVRYSIEPIGDRAGLSSDYFNTHTSAELVHTIQRSYQGVDLTWYAHFFKELIVCEEGAFDQTIAKDNGCNSQIFLAFDLLDKETMLKVYFLPALKAMETGQCKLLLVEKAISTLSPHGHSLSSAFSLVSEYIQSQEVGYRPEVEILAVDCVNPTRSRVKVYLRSRQTSFDSVVNMMTLGGRLEKLSKEGLANLEELWRLLFSLDQTVPTSEPLHLNNHRTAGVLYYFEFQPRRLYPKPKVYIPVKHYGKNDLEVANGLSTYLESKGKRLCDTDYRDSLQRLCKHRPLDQGSGLHTYIACAIEEASLAITAYINPEIYHRCRHGLDGLPEYPGTVGDFDQGRVSETMDKIPGNANTDVVRSSDLKHDLLLVLPDGSRSQIDGWIGSMELYIVALLLCVTIASVVVLTVPQDVKEAVVKSILIWLHPVTSDYGEEISSPLWQWPDGQLIDKFLHGRQRSDQWQVLGSVYRIWSGMRQEIVITMPEDVQIFHSDSQYHNKAESANGGWFFHQLLGECMGLVNGPRWKNLRSEFDLSFSHRAVMQRSADIQDEACRFLDRLKTDHGHEPFTKHASAAFMKFPFFCTSHLLYGPMTESEKDRLWSIGQTRLALMRHVIKGGILRYKACKWLKSTAVKELTLFQKEWAAFNRDMYHSRMELDPPPSIVTLERSEMEGRLSKIEILQTLDEMLFANLDVTTHVLTWMITLLADEESTQQKLRDEIRNMQGPPDVYCNRKDTLLHFCLMEAIRLRPPAVFSIPESSPSAKRLGGFNVPPNTSVLVDILAINVRNPFWGRDSQKFMPERFRDVKQADLRYNLFAYGFGPRKCLGQYLAEHSIKMLVTPLIDQYELTLRHSQNKGADYKVEEGNWIPLADVELDLSRLI